MSVKKIFDLIFEPVEEEEDIEEEIVIDEPLKSHNFTDQEPLNKPEIPEVERVQVEVKKKEVPDKTFIDADRGTKRSSGNINNPIQMTKYESQPALSPIFGALDPEKSYNQTNYVQPRSSSKKSSLGTVLSPIYGDMGQKEATEEKELIVKTDEEVAVFTESNVEPFENSFDDIETIVSSEVEADVMAETEDDLEPSITSRTPISTILGGYFEEEELIEEPSEDITLFDDIER